MSRYDLKPPKDINQFWLAPHCGPGTLNTYETCGFCGRTHKECAMAFSDHINKHPDYSHDGDSLGDGQDDPEVACGGSGFWCSGCGRFWAQNSCGENQMEDHQSSDDAKPVLRILEDGRTAVHCVCGKQWCINRQFEGE